MSESGNDVRRRVPTTSIAEWPDAEVFLLTALRCWLAGYETGDIACWELAWQGVSRNRPIAEMLHALFAYSGRYCRPKLVSSYFPLVALQQTRFCSVSAFIKPSRCERSGASESRLPRFSMCSSADDSGSENGGRSLSNNASDIDEHQDKSTQRRKPNASRL